MIAKQQLGTERDLYGATLHFFFFFLFCRLPECLHPPNMESSGTKRSTSTSRNKPSSRPTTPLRPTSRTSLRDGQGFSTAGSSSQFPLDSLEPAFAELSDSMADMEANFMHLQLMHESLSRFNESFASFLYGLNMNAFCVDFPEVSSNAPA